jgi:serine/threonine protein kinase
VATKALSPLLARDQALQERFIREANIQAGLRHSRSVQALTTEMESEQPALVNEYVGGKSFAQVLDLQGALLVDDALEITALNTWVI